MDNGFAIVPNVFEHAEVDAILRTLEGKTPHRSRAGARHLLALPAVAGLAADARLLALASEALGAEPIPFGATLFDKSQDANWLVVWHQDRALPMAERREAAGWGPWSQKDGVLYANAPATALAQVVALRVHLDDSTPDNGPLRVLPGTHALGVLSDEQIQDVARRIEPVVCAVQRGGVIAMRPLIVHASSKVAVAAPRRVLHLEYASASVFDGAPRLCATTSTPAPVHSTSGGSLAARRRR